MCWTHLLRTKKKERKKNQKHYNHGKFFVFSPTDSGSAVLFYLDTVTGRCCSCINYELYSQRPYWSEPPTGNNEITWGKRCGAPHYIVSDLYGERFKLANLLKWPMTLAISDLISYCRLTGFIHPQILSIFHKKKGFLTLKIQSFKGKWPPAAIHVPVRYPGLGAHPHPGQSLDSSVNTPYIKLRGVIKKWHVSCNH